MNCRHCYIPNHSSYGLKYEEIIDILTQLRELNTFELVLTGGEIFLRNDIMDIIAAARDLGFNLQLFTNISLLNEEIIRILAEHYIDKISCTVYSLDSSIHDDITGVPGSLEATLNNAEILARYQVPLEVKCILMKSNCYSYRDLQNYCDSNGFAFLPTASVFPQTNGSKLPMTYSIEENDLKIILPEIDVIRELDRKRSVTHESPICNSINYSIAINSEGTVYPCNMLPIPLGNTKSTSIKEIWNNSSVLTELREIKYSDLEKCSTCLHIELCYRCAGIALLETGNLYSHCTVECSHAKIRAKYN